MAAPRQDRFFLCAVLTLVGVAGVATLTSYRSSARARDRQATEMRELDTKFTREAARLERRLEELKTQSLRAIPLADRKRFPDGVVSASVWEKSATGFSRVAGLAPETVWETALYRVLPAEISRHSGFAVIPVRDTLRLALFPEPGAARFTAIAFRPRALFTGATGAESTRQFILDESGLVLAHSRPSEVGTMAAARASLYRGTETAHGKGFHLAAKSWEGFPTTVRFEHLPGWNAYFVMEKTHAPVKATTSPTTFWVCALGVLLALVFLGLGMIKPRAPAETTPMVPAPELGSELARFVAARDARSETANQNRSRREKLLLAEFAAQTKRVRTIDDLETKLVTSVTEATRSPVLFFRYDAAQGIARLSAEAGFPGSRSLRDSGGMSFAIAGGFVAGIPSELSAFSPLGRVMRMRLGIVNFTAWPLIEKRSPHAGPARLLGVLVVTEFASDGTLRPAVFPALLDQVSGRLESWIPNQRNGTGRS